jgi:outer membrane protein assembly factor BamD (BamD/ComL family)
MDEAIKKASIVIQRHSMIFDGEEKNPWVRESYLLIGKAQFYKHDYWAAIETFQFVASSYNNFPIRYEALLWLTQCYLQLGKTPDAEYLLDFLKNDKGFPWKEKHGEYAAVAADFYIQKENFEQAAGSLRDAVEHSRDKRDRIRYMVILGQLYQKLGRYQDAWLMYEGVSKRNSTYEM